MKFPSPELCRPCVRFSIASPSRDVLAIKLNVTRASPAGASRLVGLDGLEPSTSRLSGARSSHLSYRPVYSKAYSVRSTVLLWWDSNLILERSSRDRSRLTISYSNFRFAVRALRIENWWRWWDSNPWPPACRAGALPTELHPQIECRMLNAECRIGFVLSDSDWSLTIEQQTRSVLREYTSLSRFCST